MTGFCTMGKLVSNELTKIWTLYAKFTHSWIRKSSYWGETESGFPLFLTHCCLVPPKILWFFRIFQLNVISRNIICKIWLGGTRSFCDVSFLSNIMKLYWQSFLIKSSRGRTENSDEIHLWVIYVDAAWKVSKYGVFLVRIFLYSDWKLSQSEYRKIRTRKNSVCWHFSRRESHLIIRCLVTKASINKCSALFSSYALYWIPNLSAYGNNRCKHNSSYVLRNLKFMRSLQTKACDI